MLKPRLTNRGFKTLLLLLWSVFFIATFSDPALSQTTILAQPPTQIDAHMSDAKLQTFPSLPGPTGVSVADNFILSSQQTLAQIRIWGLYAGGNSSPATDNFTVVIHSDAAGLPGTALSTQHNVSATRQVTGQIVGGAFTEYAYTLMLNPVILDPGIYWVEIYNDTTGNPATFFWEFGALDSAHGIPAAAFVFTALFGSNWQVLSVDSDRQDLAIEITSAATVPTLTDWGMLIMSVLLGGTAIFFIRKKSALNFI